MSVLFTHLDVNCIYVMYDAHMSKQSTWNHNRSIARQKAAGGSTILVGSDGMPVIMHLPMSDAEFKKFDAEVDDAFTAFALQHAA